MARYVAIMKFGEGLNATLQEYITGEEIQIAAAKTVKFAASKAFKDAVNA